MAKAMTDIVEQLRRERETDYLAMKAAAEIERLHELLWQEAGNRTKIERLRITVNDQAATITKLFEEVVQLQERIKRATTS